jgi:NAD(P)-dependent dehydrogenase (short-subunit alcohol dehydrogenase family)
MGKATGEHDEWAVVLGGSVGSGAAIARAVANSPGLNVFLAHRGNHAEAAAQVEADVLARERRVARYIGDVGTAEGSAAGAKALAEVVEKKSVRLFVHSLASASVGHLTGPSRLVVRQVQKTFDVMAHSFLFWVQELLELDLLAPGARILGLTNPLDESMLVDCGLIAATKGALDGYMRALALELGPKGYRVNLLKFSTVITPASSTASAALTIRFSTTWRICVGSVSTSGSGPGLL